MIRNIKLYMAIEHTEPTIEAARSQEMPKGRFNQATAEDMSRKFDQLSQEIMAKYPEIGTYGLCTLIADALPQRLPAKYHHIAVQAIGSVGDKAVLLLNAKTIKSAVDHMSEEKDSADDRDEMAQSGIASVLENLSTFNPNIPINIQIYNAARDGIAKYIAARDVIPVSDVMNPKYKVIRAMIDGEVGHFPLNQTELDVLLQECGVLLGHKNPRALRDYVEYTNALTDEDVDQVVTIDQEERDVLDHPLEKELRGIMRDALATLPQRRRDVLRMLYGFNGREMTLEEVGNEFGVSGSWIGVLRDKALRRLQDPYMPRALREYSNPTKIFRAEPASGQRSYQEKQLRTDIAIISNSPIEQTISDLTAHGIRDIADLFSAPFPEIMEEFDGNKGTLLFAAGRVLGMLDPLYKESANGGTVSNPLLLQHISNAILYRNLQSDLARLPVRERAVIEMRGGTFDRNNYTEEELADLSSLSPQDTLALEVRARQRLTADAYLILEYYYNLEKYTLSEAVRMRKRDELREKNLLTRRRRVNIMRRKGEMGNNLIPGIGLTSDHIKGLADIKLEEMGMSGRPFNALKASGFRTIGQLLALSPYNLRGVRSLGKKSINEIGTALQDYIEDNLGITLEESTIAQMIDTYGVYQ